MQTSQAEIIQQNPYSYLIWGTLDFSTVPGLIKRMDALLKESLRSPGKQAVIEKVVLDLSRITECNSAALALVLEMVRLARASNIILHIEHLPQTVFTIARAYGAEEEIREICQ